MIKSELSGATLLVDFTPKRLCSNSNSVYLSSNQTHSWAFRCCHPSGRKSLCWIFLLTCACIRSVCHPDCGGQSSQAKVRSGPVMRTTSGVTLGVSGARTAAGVLFYFQTKGTFFFKKKKSYPVITVHMQQSASKWPVFICDTHQGVRRETRRSFCQLLFAPWPKSVLVSNGSCSCAGGYFPKVFFSPPGSLPTE